MGSKATTAGFVVVAALLVALVAFRQGDPGRGGYHEHHAHDDPRHTGRSHANATVLSVATDAGDFPSTSGAPTAAQPAPTATGETSTVDSPTETQSSGDSNDSLDRACREAYVAAMGTRGPESADLRPATISDVDIPLPIAAGLPKLGDSLAQKAWWNGEKKLERHSRVPNKRVFTSVRLRARAIAVVYTPSGSNGSNAEETTSTPPPPRNASDLLFCPGSFKVVVACANCRDFDPTQRITEAVLAQREHLASAAGGSTLRDTIDGSTLQARALGPDPLPPALSTVMTAAEEVKAPQVAFTQAVADAGFGPDGLVASLHGPQLTAALARWHPASANGTSSDDEFEAAMRLDAAPATPHAVVAQFTLDVLHVWSGWTHLLQLPRYGLTRPLHLLKDKRLSLRVLLPGRGDQAASTTCNSTAERPSAVKRMFGAWHRFDTVPPPQLVPPAGHTASAAPDATNATSGGGTRVDFKDPPAAPVVSVFPYLSGQQMTHTMPWLPGRHAFVPECPRPTSSKEAAEVPPPYRDCHLDGRRGSTPPLQCAVRRRLWRLLHGTLASGRPAFDGRTFLFIGESQASQLSRQIETVVDGDLVAENVAVPPELKPFPPAHASNGQPVPYSHGYVPGEKRTALRVYSSPPVSKIGLDRSHGGNRSGALRANFFDFNDRFDMNVSAIDAAWLRADYVVVMFCQFLVIRGVPIDEYEVRFARYLLALHGLGPDGHRVAHPFSDSTVVALATCPPVAVRNAFVLSHATPDYYRIRFRDHRNHYSLRLFGLAAMRVGRFVNRQLARHGRPPMLLIDHFDAFLPLAESTYDGDHWFGSDANLAAAENLLSELLNERRRRSDLI